MRRQWLHLHSGELSTVAQKLPPVNFWNSQIRQSVNLNDALRAISIFRQMKHNRVEPNNFTLPFVAQACAKLSNLTSSQILHAQFLKSPFYSDVYVQTSLLDLYVKCDRLDIAHQVFVRMPHRDVTSWNAMLVGFSQLGFPDRVFEIFRYMRFAGMLPDSVTVMGVSRAVSFVENLELAKGLHAFGIRIGIDSDVTVANTWISLYAKCGDLGLAELVFGGIEPGLRSVVSLNSMIGGYANSGRCSDALNMYQMLLFDGFRADISTIVSLLSSCAQPEALCQGRLIHSHGIRFGCDVDVTVCNTLISMYSKCGDIDSARFLFDGMCHRSSVSWTAMIGGYAEKGNLDEVLALFKAMETTVEKPDLVTVLSVISGCGNAGILESGRWIHNYAKLIGLENHVPVNNALIDMYAKCGSIDEAREIFYTMPDRTVVSWTVMISGCALNGLFKEALDLFCQMRESSLKPNSITFLSVLQACSHGGFLEKGWELFNLMTKEYNINPGVDHCSCMVDLLGRAGRLNEVLDFVLNMPVKPDAAIWSALLCYCKIHNKVEIAEYAASRLFELDPTVAVPYVEMANVYASAGKWENFAGIRNLMKHNRLKKYPGKSSVEVNGKLFDFTVEDRRHVEGKTIYAVLENLVLQLKEEVHDEQSLGFGELEAA
ncbi:Pentatricopeptide repeat-containing protein At4g19191, mitochondrial [Linum perenne]